MANSPYCLARDPNRDGRPGTLHARSVSGRLTAEPRQGLIIRFGRGEPPEVDLPVGVDDQGVSREHGLLTYRRDRWWLRNTGQRLVRLPPGRLMHTSSRPIPLTDGYTPVFVKGLEQREHLVELYVTGHDTRGNVPRRQAPTVPEKIWPLEEDERLLLVTLGQDYLRYTQDPSPLTYAQAVELLTDLRPEDGWHIRRAQEKIVTVRRRLCNGFPYPLAPDSDVRPSDNRYLRNLLKGLIESTTLVPPDLALIDEEPD